MRGNNDNVKSNHIEQGATATRLKRLSCRT